MIRGPRSPHSSVVDCARRGTWVRACVEYDTSRDHNGMGPKEAPRLAEEMGIDEDQLQGVQWGVYIRGAPITLSHPEARDHVYTLDEVCGVILDAGYGLRGKDGELICKP